MNFLRGIWPINVETPSLELGALEASLKDSKA